MGGRRRCALVSACAPAVSGNADNIATLEKARTENPKSEAALRSLGIAYFKANRYTEARAALSEAVKANPKDGVASLYLGLTAEAQNDLPAARTAYESYLAVGKTRGVKEQINARLHPFSRDGKTRRAPSKRRDSGARSRFGSDSAPRARPCEDRNGQYIERDPVQIGLWLATVNGSRSSTTRRRLTPSAARCSRSSFARSPWPPSSAAVIRREIRGSASRSTRRAASSMPKENIERAIKKGTGELEGVDYQEVTYEGYGPGGVALLIDAVTDNPTRTVADVRAKMSRLGGNLGTPNSVAWMFEKKGQIYVDATKIDEDALMEARARRRRRGRPARGRAISSSRPSPTRFHAVQAALEGKGVDVVEAELAMVPKNTVQIAGKDAESLLKLLETLEELDDVQKVWANFDIDVAELAKVEG